MVVRVRPITNDAGNRLRRIVRHGQDAIEVKRAQVILASAQGFTPPKIGFVALMSEDYVRELIHAFNLHGFSMPKPHWGPGPKAKFSDGQRQALVALATSRPRDLELAFTQWSLSRAREAAIDRGIVPSISEEWLRVLLHEADVSYQSLRTWKKSDHPEREVKKEYIAKLTRQPHDPPVVLSGDEIGPIQLVPQGGSGWFPRGTPGRIPAEYHREFGTAYYFLMLNVYHQTLSGQSIGRSTRRTGWSFSLRRVRSPPGRAGLSDSGRALHSLDTDGAAVGQGAPGDPGAHGHPRELDEPRGEPRRGPPEARARREYPRIVARGECAFRQAISYRGRERALRKKRFRDPRCASGRSTGDLYGSRTRALILCSALSFSQLGTNSGLEFITRLRNFRKD
jgi:transposase